MKTKIIPALLLAAIMGMSAAVGAAGDDETKFAAADKEECLKRLKTIYDAIQAYRRDNKDLPNWLSDLVPKYLADTSLLICPVTKRTGEFPGPYAPDPKMKISYGYQFRAGEMGDIWNGDKITMKEWKRKQMGLIGGDIPMVRCYLHGQQVLNAAFSGKISEGPMTWENDFTEVVNFDDFSPESLMKREIAEAGKTAAAAPVTDAQFDALSPADQYQALVREYSTAQRDFNRAYSKAKTDEERKKILDETYPRPQKFAKRFLAVAQKAPDDPAAVDALVWVVNQVRFGTEVNEAMGVLMDRHLKSERIQGLVEMLPNTGNRNAEKALREIIDKNPSHDVQGAACFSLATILKRDPKNEKEADLLFNRVIDKYGGVKRYNGTLATVARSELFELHNLAIGKPSPEIDGEDADGKEFKLTSYRGKVVLIDFWGDW